MICYCFSQALCQTVGNYNNSFNRISVLFFFLFLGSGGKYPSIKKLEHALEDQIYHILRKSRVITNIRYEELGWYYTEIYVLTF